MSIPVSSALWGCTPAIPFVAEELAQDALVRVCRDWERISTMAAPGAYAHRAAMNLANSWFRRRRARQRAIERYGDPNDGVHREACTAEAVAVRAAVATLSPKRRTAVVLCFFLGYSTKEAAEAMDVKPATVRSFIHRAKHDLKEALVDAEHTEMIHG